MNQKLIQNIKKTKEQLNLNKTETKQKIIEIFNQIRKSLADQELFLLNSVEQTKKAKEIKLDQQEQIFVEINERTEKMEKMRFLTPKNPALCVSSLENGDKNKGSVDLNLNVKEVGELEII